ncbi:unknown [Bacteroides thetaiotaomicron CAG:40]|nr:unknown [Bacteroides thetaiotaomicron CAG:40]
MDLHRRRWRERLQPEKQYLSLVPPRRRQEQYLAQQRQGNLLRPDRGDYVDRHTLGRTEQTRPAHQPLYRLPDESGRPDHTALGHCTRHRALRRQTDHRHTKRSLPFQPGNGHLRTSFQGYQRRQKYRYGGQPLHRQGQNAMGFRYRRGRIFLPLRHRQAHPLCTQSLHSEHSQQQQCQQHHAGQQR